MRQDLLIKLQEAWLGATTKLQDLEVLDEARSLVFRGKVDIKLFSQTTTH